ncbi:hypothetical protein F4678DRAFT_459618 [Xylaria arbuscula]|nr:hypothetical protein F4678DRAFT_459618 [Xylaria arbuscula]
MAARGACQHNELLLECSPWAEEAGFERPDAAKRLAAAIKAGRNPLATAGKSAKAIEKLSREAAARLAPSFPGPLLLPKDALNWEPNYPAQSFRSWSRQAERNKITPDRKTLYVVASPTITSEVDFMNGWEQPAVACTEGRRELETPSANAIVEYLSAFYHGLPVKFFPHELRFVPWTGTSRRTKSANNHASASLANTKTAISQAHIGFACNDYCARIRTRETPDKKFIRQLNLGDILHAATEMLPDDAYTIALLMDFDMFEDPDDDFCCGRALGAGSRVCVVSSARYSPALDEESIDHEHMWPTSHCKKFADRLCAVEDLEPQKHIKSVYETPDSPLRRAVQAAKTVPTLPTVKALNGLWFSRVVRTLVHEVGHCFAIDHCVYYACNMQGTSCIAEDLRQPPYLCPVCLEKVTYAIACELQQRDRAGKEAYVEERYRAIAKFCEAWKHVGLFAGYGAWVQARLQQLTS